MFELGARYARSQMTCLARINGRPVGVLASNVMFHAGAMTAQSSEKLIRFIDMCDTFHIPVVNIVDQPGIAIGSDAERRGTIRYAARALATVYQARTPMIVIIVRRLFGVAGAALIPGTGARRRYAWPSARWGTIPPEGGIEVAYRREIAAAADPEQEKVRIGQQLDRLTSPFRTAEHFGIEEIIDPRETPALLREVVQRCLCRPGQGHGPSRIPASSVRAPGKVTAQVSNNPGVPLEGLRVLEVGHYIAGPHCTQILSDWGARVVKLERPTGDPGRASGTQIKGNGLYFAVQNRGKESLAMDLKSAGGRDAIRRLIRWADVVVSNYSPAALEKLDLAYPTLREAQPCRDLDSGERVRPAQGIPRLGRVR